jgi:hypothetical protein
MQSRKREQRQNLGEIQLQPTHVQQKQHQDQRFHTLGSTRGRYTAQQQPAKEAEIQQVRELEQIGTWNVVLRGSSTAGNKESKGASQQKQESKTEKKALSSLSSFSFVVSF